MQMRAVVGRGDRVGDDAESLFREHYAGLVRMAALMTDSRQLAEEIVQDAFAEVIARWDRIQPDRAEHYVRRAVANRARSALRRRRTVRNHRPPGAGHEPPPDDAVLRRADGDLLAAGISRLPTRQRQVLVLRYYVGASIAETAQTLDISAAAVTTSTHRALRALAALKEDLR